MYRKKDDITARNFLINLLYTIILNTLIAFFLIVANIVDSFPKSIVISQSIGICIYSIIMFLLHLIKPEKKISEIFIILAGVSSGAFIGWQIGPYILQRFFLISYNPHTVNFWQKIILGLAFGLACSYFFQSKERLKMSEKLIQEEKIKRLAKEKEALEANLKMLQAQIEPHFLFNTLSNVISLIDTNPAKGKTMLTDLIHYLRTTLTRTRHDLITIDQEIEIIKAYLDIIKIRMGDRLKYEIMIPENLKSHPLPPMLLQPLVENAVKHGLEPKIEGGNLIINAIETGNFIRIELNDTGMGLSNSQDSGVGIANVRERLNLLYGEKGHLILEENKPHGLKVIIEVPKHEH